MILGWEVQHFPSGVDGSASYGQKPDFFDNPVRIRDGFLILNTSVYRASSTGDRFSGMHGQNRREVYESAAV